MKEITKKKLPNSKLIVHNFSSGLPDELKEQSFDAVITTYAIHHLTYPQQISLINEIMKISDSLFIGDVMTKTEEEMIESSEMDSDIWDSTEYYLIVDNLIKALPQYTYEFIKKSYCSGILKITK